MKNLTCKQVYLQPQIEVIEVQNEASVMTGSNTLPGVGVGGGIFQSSRSRATHIGTKHQQTNSLQELEDMLNDLLTF
ncbi:hypothetical protein [Bacteroides sp. 224]|uniref:hypothetical protein n=1 Tax=Bacteroides sp. 224 TaxID=2302936 RepID=UPI0013D1AF2F|nr:hypothetical protein [Bacteroides sp. 224]NDV64871.1 hypothetical protein [Bacteroides sp. 224]